MINMLQGQGSAEDHFGSFIKCYRKVKLVQPANLYQYPAHLNAIAFTSWKIEIESKITNELINLFDH